MSLGWSASGVTGPVTADTTETPNLVWAMGGGTLFGFNAVTGAQVISHSVGLDGSQHFATPLVVPNWVIVEQSNRHVAGFTTPGASIGQTSWTSPPLDGQVQSRPVTFGNTVVVATESDSLYGLDLATGAIVWGGSAASPTTHFGTPEPLSEARSVGNAPGCGNVDPLGVTGNLVYDPTTSKVFAVGERETGTVSPHPPEHVLVGVDPVNGAIGMTANVDVPAMNGADTKGVARHQQRAGLAVANGNVIVGFGGLFGDCGEYHGFVVAASATDGHVVGSFEVAPSDRGGAVWGTSGPAVDGSGNVYATTGNGIGSPSSGTDWSDGLLKLNSSAALQDYFQPPAWRADNNADLDLGSTGSVLTQSETKVFVIGKQHDAFLLNVSALGGANHETPAASLANACPGMAFGQNAVIGSSAYVACSSGLQQVHLG